MELSEPVGETLIYHNLNSSLAGLAGQLALKCLDGNAKVGTEASDDSAEIFATKEKLIC